MANKVPVHCPYNGRQHNKEYYQPTEAEKIFCERRRRVDNISYERELKKLHSDDFDF